MKKSMLSLLPLLLCALVAILLSGCKTRYVTVPEYHFRDTTKMVYLRDSVFLHDSVFVTVETKGDTVYNTKTVTKYLYKDKFRTDTLAIIKRDSVPKIVMVEKSLTPSQSFAIRWFGVLVAVLILAMIWIFRKPMVVLIKQLCK